MNSKFIDKLRELEPKHYVVIVVATIVFAGAIYGIIDYRQGNINEEPTDIEKSEEDIQEEVPVEITENIDNDEVMAEAPAKSQSNTTNSDYSELNESGPETLWIGELTALSGSAVLWGVSKKRKVFHS